MIQHLFPTEANSKPLTPPPAQQPQPPAPRHQAAFGHAHARRPVHGSGSGNPAAAPFRPPRFVGPTGGSAQPAFTGMPSSRANAASLTMGGLGMAGGSMGLASLSGRSVSGPRPHPTAPAVASLAELGVRPGREGGTSATAGGAASAAGAGPAGAGPRRERERRRSRSAERWDGEPPLVAAPAAVAEPARGGALTASTAAPPSLLMQAHQQLMAQPSAASRSGLAAVRPLQPASFYAAGIGGGAAPAPAAAASSQGSQSLNPFLRPARPAQQAAGRSGSSGVSGSQGSQRSGDVPSGRGAGDGAAPGGGAAPQFTASQRALLGVRGHAGRGPSTGSGRVATVTSAAPTRSLHNGSGRDGDADPAAGDSIWALDDASALELLPDTQSQRPLQQLLRTSRSATLSAGAGAGAGADGANGASGTGAGSSGRMSSGGGRRMPDAAADTAEDQSLGSRLASRLDSRGRSAADTGQAAGRDQGAFSETHSGPLATASHPAEPAAAAVMRTISAAAGMGIAVGHASHYHDDDDEDISLEGLDVLSPAPSVGLGTPMSVATPAAAFAPSSGSNGDGGAAVGAVAGAGFSFDSVSALDVDSPEMVVRYAAPLGAVAAAAAAGGGGYGGVEVVPSTPESAMPGAPSPSRASPTWEQLDEMMARNLRAMDVTPPSLPRLRIAAPRFAAPAAAPPAAPPAAAPAQATAGTDPRVADPAQQAPSVVGVEGHGRGASFDPDDAGNYDGEDPTADDTFFESPFFDESLLWEGDRRSGDGDGGDAEARAPDDVARPQDPENWVVDGGVAPGRGTAVAVEGTRVAAPVQSAAGAARGVAAINGGRPDVGATGGAPRAAPPGRCPQAGDRDCPIDLLSDSEDDEGDASADSDGEDGRVVRSAAAVRAPAPAVPSRQPAAAAGRPAVGRVVPGLRRPVRSRS